MALGPRFSAQKFQSVLQSALGTNAQGVTNSLRRVGADRVLRKDTTSVADAKQVLKRLQTHGAIEDTSRAQDVFRKAARVAAAADRIQRESRIAELKANYEQTRSVVREQLHSVSITGDKNIGSHAVSISQITKKSSDGVQKISPHAATQPVIKPLLDIPFD